MTSIVLGLGCISGQNQPKNPKQRRQEETFGDDVGVYGADCGNGFTGIYLPPNTSSCIH